MRRVERLDSEGSSSAAHYVCPKSKSLTEGFATRDLTDAKDRRGSFPTHAAAKTRQYVEISSADTPMRFGSPLAGGLLSGKFSRTKQKAADSRRDECSMRALLDFMLHRTKASRFLPLVIFV
ncbi:MAG: hypothetical protein E6H52_20705 [Betaproteobacteria bacterium]|nr:MAG: hypothetical protein E6H52_20705 [Betaproteobacteria bacterium]